MEMLRMRAALERAEVASAMADLRRSTHRLRALASAASSVGAALSGQGAGWAGVLASAGSRSRLVALALSALRSAKRHPWLAVAAAGAVAIGIHWARKEPTPEGEPAAAP
jgi:hypothetical protein